MNSADPSRLHDPASPDGRGRRLLVLLAALALIVLTARLGLWQLDRAAGKVALQTALERQREAPPVTASALPVNADDLGPLLHRRIELQGRWLPQHTIYLENRQMDGRPGFFVLTPLTLPDGRTVLVQRGWLPRDAADRQRIAEYHTPDGVVPLLARIATWPSRLTALGEDGTDALRQNLDHADYERQTSLALPALSLVELPQPGNARDGLRRNWLQPALDVHKHYGYAAQWFALSALTAGLYVWFQLIRPRRRARHPTRHG